jgi:hypothetical protein
VTHDFVSVPQDHFYDTIPGHKCYMNMGPTLDDHASLRIE